MTKWLVLVAGAFLFSNGPMSRTYGCGSAWPHGADRRDNTLE